jgi:hypothetical protein
MNTVHVHPKRRHTSRGNYRIQTALYYFTVCCVSLIDNSVDAYFNDGTLIFEKRTRRSAHLHFRHYLLGARTVHTLLNFIVRQLRRITAN